MGRPAKPEGERVRDIAPTGVRLQPELRAALEREASINGRTLSAEIIRRLKASLEVDHVRTELRLGEVAPTVQVSREGPAGKPLSDGQRMILAIWDQMPPEKQLALLTVLKR